MGFSSAPQSIDENSKNIIKTSAKIKWLPIIESEQIYNAMSRNYKGLTDKAQNMANSIAKPLLYALRSAMPAQIGFSQFVLILA